MTTPGLSLSGIMHQEDMVDHLTIPDAMKCRRCKDGLPWGQGQELRPPEDRDGRTP